MDRQKLIQTAIDGLPKSYAPYSHFHVSAALLCRDGTVFTGNNIENASYTPSVCAERCAFFKAVSEGKREFRAICIVNENVNGEHDFCAPCGVCRQVMMEFCGKEFEIILVTGEDCYEVHTLGELLPMGFGPEDLERSPS